ncbi:unnamed protein product [Gongylonema pulchrum]|uniref:Ras-GAP domain-containing protein n=1 Tax=Gongylonema pulchrum TaxID=637853 RepID=A0A183CZR7_9BILA|nr:unnamed protein product [Gongylonema pulchrum]
MCYRYPNVFSILLSSVDVWADCTDVTSPALKLLAELCQNRQQRLQFEMSSCSAVLLFREVSKIICTYGTRMLSLPKVSPEIAYKQRYKNIGAMFSVLKVALGGSYIPFGILRLYGDSCLQDVLDLFIKLFTYISEDDFQSYPKIAQSFHGVLDFIAADNFCFLSHVKPEVFTAMLRYIQRGAVSLDPIVVSNI